ncbi:MAG: YraN family protein [Flavobacteriaceae bacterium]
MSKSFAFGKEAEARAEKYFLAQGYTILERNYYYGKAEVDLIVQKDALLVAVEVKARHSDYFGPPESFVSQKQINRLITAIDAYIQKRDLWVEVRFDILSFTLKNGQWQQKHIENAFYSF